MHYHCITCKGIWKKRTKVQRSFYTETSLLIVSSNFCQASLPGSWICWPMVKTKTLPSASPVAILEPSPLHLSLLSARELTAVLTSGTSVSRVISHKFSEPVPSQLANTEGWDGHLSSIEYWVEVENSTIARQKYSPHSLQMCKSTLWTPNVVRGNFCINSTLVSHNFMLQSVDEVRQSDEKSMEPRNR